MHVERLAGGGRRGAGHAAHGVDLDLGELADQRLEHSFSPPRKGRSLSRQQASLSQPDLMRRPW